MKKIPIRVCSQRFDEVICVLCSFNNLLQLKSFSSPKQLIENYRFLCRQHGLEEEKKVSDKNGLIQDVLKIYFDTHGYHVKKVKKNEKNVGWGWAIFKLSYQSFQFYHMVAIVHNYTIDSIVLKSNNGGVYPWDGHLYGYDKEQLEEVYKIDL